MCLESPAEKIRWDSGATFYQTPVIRISLDDSNYKASNDEYCYEGSHYWTNLLQGGIFAGEVIIGIAATVITGGFAAPAAIGFIAGVGGAAGDAWLEGSKYWPNGGLGN